MKDGVGELLRRLREEKRLSKLRLSELSGVDRGYITSLEKGVEVHRITLQTVKSLAKGLGVPPEIFLLPEDLSLIHI